MEPIKQEEGSFYMEKNGRRVAEISYSSAGSQTISADHTFVDSDLRGGGVAGQLLDALVEYARQEKLSIVPACSYVAAKFSKSSAYDDVNATK